MFKKTQKESYDLEFVKNGLPRHNGKLVYTHPLSGVLINMNSDSILWKGNVVTFTDQYVGEVKGKENLLINLFSFVKENKNSTLQLETLRTKIVDFVNKCKQNKQNWAITINRDSSLDVLGYTFSARINNLNVIFKDSCELLLLNVLYNPLDPLFQIDEKVFVNYVIRYDDIKVFHAKANIEYYLDKGFVICLQKSNNDCSLSQKDKESVKNIENLARALLSIFWSDQKFNQFSTLSKESTSIIYFSKAKDPIKFEYSVINKFLDLVA